MIHMLVRHKVADFDKWRAVFDSNAEAQKEAGLRLKQLLRNVDDPNEVFLFFEVDDLEAAKGFVNAPEAHDAKEDSGVIDEPDCYLLR
jgi:heme-degrading monooxygenase HmoA